MPCRLPFRTHAIIFASLPEIKTFTGTDAGTVSSGKSTLEQMAVVFDARTSRKLPSVSATRGACSAGHTPAVHHDGGAVH
jgi:hypothetical protein